MVSKFLCLCLLALLSLKSLHAQHESKLALASEAQFLVAGELNASYDFILGGRANYFFSSHKKSKTFLSLGIATDIADSNARLISTDIQLGVNWKLNKLLSLDGTIGSIFINESHAQQLIERLDVWNNNLLGVTGSVGLKFTFSQSLSANIFLKQINLFATSIGLGIQFSI